MNIFLNLGIVRIIIAIFRYIQIIGIKYGHLLSRITYLSRDGQRKPIPWFTYPAIEYIKQLDLAEKIVFEWGSGYSTLFFSKKAKKIISIEDDINWHGRLQKEKISATKLLLYIEKEKYINSILEYHFSFDVIIIDGKWRLECAKKAIQKLNPGGIIILDNSDWTPKVASYLRNSNLIQVDMIGFSPVNAFITVTSIFFHREFKFNYSNKNRFVNIMGSKKFCCQP